MTVFDALEAEGIDADTQAVFKAMIDQLRARHPRNKLRRDYYDGRYTVDSLGISIPPSMSTLETVVGWPSTVVDVLEERLDVDGITVGSDDEASVLEVWTSNQMPVDSGMAHLDALITGVTFIAVSPGADGEPPVLLTSEPASNMTGIWNARSRRLDYALSGHWSTNDWTDFTLFTESQVIECRPDAIGRWSVEVRGHGLDRVPVTRLVNKPRTGRQWGRSEISRPVMSYTDNAVRTMLGMEVAREFYSAPQRYIMGAASDAFTRPDGSVAPAWESYLGRWLAMERDEDGNLPTVGQFSASSPAPYIDQLKGLAQMLSAEASIPPSYLGFHTDNPPSADGIRAQEARLVKRAERRQRVFGAAWNEALRMALTMRDGSAPDVQVRWRDAATPTVAAMSDAATKLVSVGVLPAESDVTLEKIGLDPAEVERVKVERRRSQARSTLTSLAAAAGVGDAVAS